MRDSLSLFASHSRYLNESKSIHLLVKEHIGDVTEMIIKKPPVLPTRTAQTEQLTQRIKLSQQTDYTTSGQALQVIPWR